MSLPYLEVAVGFIVLVYVFETYLDVRQYGKSKETQRPSQLTAIVDQTTFDKAQGYLLCHGGRKLIPVNSVRQGQARFRILRVVCGRDQEREYALVVFVPAHVEACGRCADLGRVADKRNRAVPRVHAPVLGHRPCARPALPTLPHVCDRGKGFFCVSEVMPRSLNLSLFFFFCKKLQHGFNKQTLGLFFTDMIKTILLTLVIGGPFLAGTQPYCGISLTYGHGRFDLCHPMGRREFLPLRVGFCDCRAARDDCSVSECDPAAVQ